MGTFLWNLILALAWASLVGGLTPANFLVGFVLGYAALWLTRRLRTQDPYFRRIRPLLRFVGYILWEVFLSGLRIALDVITPTVRSSPGVVAYPLEAKSDAEITLLATLLSFTPGTLVLDVSPDRSTMFIHAMFVSDRDAFCRRLKSAMEKPLLEVMR